MTWRSIILPSITTGLFAILSVWAVVTGKSYIVLAAALLFCIINASVTYRPCCSCAKRRASLKLSVNFPQASRVHA